MRKLLLLIFYIFALLHSTIINAEGSLQWLKDIDGNYRTGTSGSYTWINTACLSLFNGSDGDHKAMTPGSLNKLCFNIIDYENEVAFLGMQSLVNIAYSSSTDFSYRIVSEDGTPIEVYNASGTLISGSDGFVHYSSHDTNGESGFLDVSDLQNEPFDPGFLQPAPLVGNKGYEPITLTFPANGEYHIEFWREGLDTQNKDYFPSWKSTFLSYFDLTVAKKELDNTYTEKKGRLFSILWPMYNKLNSTGFKSIDLEFFIYHDRDKLVNSFVWDDVIPGGCNVIFNSTGACNTGDLAVDRQSCSKGDGESRAQYKIFFNPPDETIFEILEVLPEITFNKMSYRCEVDKWELEMSVNRPGRIDVLLEFDLDNRGGSSGVYNANTRDTIVVFDVTEEYSNIFWDGYDAQNYQCINGDKVYLTIDFELGTMNNSVFDVEGVVGGLSHELISPSGDAFPKSSEIYYDDSKLFDSNGLQNMPDPNMKYTYCGNVDFTNLNCLHTYRSKSLDNNYGYKGGEQVWVNTWFNGSETIITKEITIDKTPSFEPQISSTSSPTSCDVNDNSGYIMLSGFVPETNYILSYTYTDGLSNSTNYSGISITSSIYGTYKLDGLYMGEYSDIVISTISGCSPKTFSTTYNLTCSTENTWIGCQNSDNDWNTPANWSLGTVPDESTRVIIPSPTSCTGYDPVIWDDQSATARSIVIEDGATLTLGTGTKLHNSIPIGSTALGGSLIVIDNIELEGTGMFYAERKLSPNVYHLICSPIDHDWEESLSNIDASITDLNGNNIQSGTNMLLSSSEPYDRFYSYKESNTPSERWVNILSPMSSGSGMNNVNFESGLGYAYFKYLNTETNTVTVQVNGYPNSGIIKAPISYTNNTTTYSNGQHLFGNPYTSTIAISKGADINNNFLDQNRSIMPTDALAIYLWSEQPNYHSARNDYLVICHNGFAGEDECCDEEGRLQGEYIMPFQGFMMLVRDGLASDAMVTFDPSIQKHDDRHESDASLTNRDTPFYKKSVNGSNRWPGVQLFLSRDEIEVSTLIGVDNSTTEGIDPGVDVKKMKLNTYANIYSYAPNNNELQLGVQGIPPSTQKINIGVDVMSSGYYTFDIYQENLSEILLEDLKTGDITDLITDKYDVYLDSGDNGTAYTDRFIIHLSSQSLDDKTVSNENENIHAGDGMIIFQNISGKYNVFDTTGREVMSGNITNSKEFNLQTNLPKGVYIIKTNNLTKKAIL